MPLMPTVGTQVAVSGTTTVTGSVVNVRTGPGTNFPVVTKVNRGATVTLRDQAFGLVPRCPSRRHDYRLDRQLATKCWWSSHNSERLKKAAAVKTAALFWEKEEEVHFSTEYTEWHRVAQRARTEWLRFIYLNLVPLCVLTEPSVSLCGKESPPPSPPS